MNRIFVGALFLAIFYIQPGSATVSFCSAFYGIVNVKSVQEKIESIKNARNLIFENYKNGFFSKLRIHIPKSETRTVRSLQNTFNLIPEVRKDLVNLLHQQRLGLVSEADWTALKSAIEGFNSFFDYQNRNDETKINNIILVYQDSSFLGKWSKGEFLLKGDFIESIETTSFDFTKGFAVEVFSSYGSGLAHFFESSTGALLTEGSYKSSKAIIGVSSDGKPIFESVYKSGLSSAYNDSKQVWEVYRGHYKTPSASVYNPITKQVEHRDGGYMTGIGGVYNPKTQQVEWETAYSSSVAGYYDKKLQKVVWEKKYKSGLSIVVRDEDGNYHYSTSFYGGVLDEGD